jgi:iron complex transport system substrate-binding protein
VRPRTILPVITLALLIAACGQASPIGSTTTAIPSTATPQPTPTSSAVPNEDLVLTDALGREVRFHRPPERIVIAGRASQLLLHAAYVFPEASGRIVAMEQRLQRGDSMLPLVDPAFNDKLQLDRDVGAEGIAPAKPDAVLMKSYMVDEMGPTLEVLGLTAVYLDLETPDQFRRDIRMLGDLFDDPARAETVLAFYENRLEALGEALADLSEDDRPEVLLLQYTDRGGEVAFSVPSNDWLQTEMVRLAGGIPAWTEAAGGGGWTVVNFEQIAAWDPDMIFVVYYPSDPSPIVETLKVEPAWGALQAVQDGQIYAFCGDFVSWDQPDTRWILGLEWLATKIHPERFAGLDLVSEVNAFYSQLYALDQSTIDTSILPLVCQEVPR